MRLLHHTLSVLTAAASAVASVSAQQVTLPNGATVTGFLKTNVAGQQVQVFRGIPYAEPPVGERRWTQAMLKPIDASVNATAFGNICYGDSRYDAQSATYTPSEDCLFLNVYTPANATSTTKLPVMVWIHGGNFVAGAGNAYDGSNLIAAADNGVVVVSLNYRLSVFGFLASEALRAEGDGVNYALRDQELAFQWVQQHIAYFGGNPSDITAFGESAGAKSVALHLYARDGGQKWFRKAIMESGTLVTVHDMPSRARQNAVAAQLATQLGCDSNASETLLSCLRSANASAVWAAGGLLGWQPVVDGVFLTDWPTRLVLAGNVSRVPTIIGTNTDEGWAFTTTVKTAEGVLPYVRARFALLSESEVERVDALYPAASFASPSHRVSEIYGDAIYACPSELASLALARSGRTTFRYRFNETSTFYGPPLALHTAEIRFVFNDIAALPQNNATQSLVHAMQRYWTNLAIHNTPNGIVAPATGGGSGGLAAWPPHSKRTLQQIVLQGRGLVLETTGAYMPLHSERCAFWTAVEQRVMPTLAL